MNELIEKLKNNERAFGLCSEEEKACFVKVGPENCLYYSRDLDWKQAYCFNPTGAICIKSDYQPKPKEIKMKLTEALCLAIEWVDAVYEVGNQKIDTMNAVAKRHGIKWGMPNTPPPPIDCLRQCLKEHTK